MEGVFVRRTNGKRYVALALRARVRSQMGLRDRSAALGWNRINRDLFFP